MRRTLLGCSLLVVLLATAAPAPGAGAGEASEPTILPVELAIDPPTPVQGDDITITVTADLAAAPGCEFVPFGLFVYVGDGDIAAPPRNLDVVFDDDPGSTTATGVLTLPDALPGYYGAYAACEGQVAYPPLSDFEVATLPEFSFAASPSTVVAGTGGVINVVGQACPFHIVEVGLVPPDALMLGFPSDVLTDVRPGMTWHTQILWTPDLAPGTYEVWARCGEGPTVGRHVNYEPVPLTISAAPQPPAPPQPQPPAFTG